MIKQKKRLEAHENLIFDVICRQAGTLSKAVLEGVMNSIDAGATRIDVSLNKHSVIISDNGRGFNSEKEIDEWFAKFGTPHEVDEDDNSVDARYGRFRMGRGQLFAFGVNQWISNQFVLAVDVKHTGLDFEVETHETIQHSGCSVRVELYTILDASTIHATTKEVTKFCKYVDVDLFLNGEKINIDPRSQTWEHETADGWIRVSASNASSHYRAGTGVDIYQQGVYVETIAAYDIGVNGTVVTKAPLKLNFARNQVMRSQCPRWKRILKVLKGVSQDANKLKSNLDANERAAMISHLVTGDMDYDDAKSMRLFQDIQGKTWSANQIKSATSRKTQFKLSPKRQLIISFARMLAPKADKIMQSHAALVFDEALLTQWNVSANDFVNTVLRKFGYNISHKVVYMPLDELDDSSSTEYRLLDENEMTTREKMVIELLDRYSYSVAHMFRDRNCKREQRVVRAGKSNHASAWTDGESFIAIDIDEIRSRIKSITLSKWCELVWIMIHEYCHDAPNTEAHTHDEHFYHLFHDVSHGIGECANAMNRSYTSMLKCRLKKIPQRFHLDTMKEAEAIHHGLTVDAFYKEKEKG